MSSSAEIYLEKLVIKLDKTSFSYHCFLLCLTWAAYTFLFHYRRSCVLACVSLSFFDTRTQTSHTSFLLLPQSRCLSLPSPLLPSIGKRLEGLPDSLIHSPVSALLLVHHYVSFSFVTLLHCICTAFTHLYSMPGSSCTFIDETMMLSLIHNQKIQGLEAKSLPW